MIHNTLGLGEDKALNKNKYKSNKQMKTVNKVGNMK